jgi:hypothetical protein
MAKTNIISNVYGSDIERCFLKVPQMLTTDKVLNLMKLVFFVTDEIS